MVAWIKKTAALIWRTLDTLADSTLTADLIFAHYNGRNARLELPARIVNAESRAKLPAMGLWAHSVSTTIVSRGIDIEGCIRGRGKELLPY